VHQSALETHITHHPLPARRTDFGHWLHEAWRANKQMSDRISNDRIDEMYEEARRHGAIGGKVTGAGGGGFMLFYCDYRSKHKVAAVLERLGATVQEFAFEQEGLRTWRASGER